MIWQFSRSYSIVVVPVERGWKIISAAQEERFTRIKHDSRYPHNAVNFVLKSLKLMKGGEIFVPKIPSYKILDLVNSINNLKKKS